MGILVFVQISKLAKSQSTTRLEAFKRSLFGVHSKVIEEVVPFLESHVAAFVVAVPDLLQFASL